MNIDQTTLNLKNSIIKRFEHKISLHLFPMKMDSSEEFSNKLMLTLKSYMTLLA